MLPAVLFTYDLFITEELGTRQDPLNGNNTPQMWGQVTVCGSSLGHEHTRHGFLEKGHILPGLGTAGKPPRVPRTARRRARLWLSL